MPAPPRAHRRHAAWLLLAGAGLACARGGSAVGDSTFVAVMAELRQVQGEAGDSTSRAARRARVLQSRGLTAASLEQAARDIAADPARANRIFQAIARKTVDAATPGVTPGPAAAPGPVRADTSRRERLRRLRDARGKASPTR